MRQSSGFPQYSKPIRVDGGLKARSERGAIGESWWSKRFLAVLESFALGTRLTRGRSYARAGQVLSLTIAPGQITANVQGSRPKPYKVSIGLRVFDDALWHIIEVSLAEQAIFSARLLAGDMPADIEVVFEAANAPLFPATVGDLTMTCSCPDFQVPCKHIAATFYLLAEEFDADPFHILHWRGREKSALLARLKQLRSGHTSAGATSAPPKPRATKASATKTSATKATATKRSTAKAAAGANATAPAIGAHAALADLSSAPLNEMVGRFWLPPVPLPLRPPTLDAGADLLLRQLPTPPAEAGGGELLAQLRLLYSQLSANGE
jgi:uncharacterized Zn finger protein